MEREPKTLWRVKEGGGQAPALAKDLKISPLLAQILVNRHITTASEAKTFLYPSLAHLHDPFLLSDMAPAVERIISALEEEASIVIYGDYDVDGVTATALLYEVLKDENANIHYYIPHRLDEGYGLNSEAMTKLAAQHQLLITVDCGISAHDQIELANTLGLDVIVTDHHLPQETLPPAHAIINPRHPKSTYPFVELAGVGVAWKLAQAILSKRHSPKQALQTLERYLDIIALGTIADVVPLVGENRIMVKYGLEKLAQTRRPGIKALLSVSRLQNQKLTPGNIAFGLAPRINAGGRIGHAATGVKLLITSSETEAEEYAAFLDTENNKRRQVEQRIEREALALVEKMDLTQQCTIVLADEGWHPGVVGIVASRLQERFHRPVILLCLVDGMWKGSGRSISAVHLFKMLTLTKAHLLSFGGHAQAAGVSLNTQALSDFKKALECAVRQHTTPQDFELQILADAKLSLAQLSLELAEELEVLQPYGMGNAKPTFISQQMKLSSFSTVGQEGAHLRMRVAEGDAAHTLMSWQQGQRATLLNPGNFLSAVFTLDINEWRGKRSLTLVSRDWRLTRVELLDQRGCTDKVAYIKNLRQSDKIVVVASYSYAALRHFAPTKRVTSLFAAPIFLHLGSNGVEMATGLEGLIFSDLVVFDIPLHTKQLQQLLQIPDISIHLLYNEKDYISLLHLVEGDLMNRTFLTEVYRWVEGQRQQDKSIVTLDHLEKNLEQTLVNHDLQAPLILAAVRILSDIGLWSYQVETADAKTKEGTKIVILWQQGQTIKALEDSRYYQFYQDLAETVSVELDKLIKLPVSQLKAHRH